MRWYSPRDWVEEETVDDTGKVTVKGQLLYPDVQCVTVIITVAAENARDADDEIVVGMFRLCKISH